MASNYDEETIETDSAEPHVNTRRQYSEFLPDMPMDLQLENTDAIIINAQKDLQRARRFKNKLLALDFANKIATGIEPKVKLISEILGSDREQNFLKKAAAVAFRKTNYIFLYMTKNICASNSILSKLENVLSKLQVETENETRIIPVNTICKKDRDYVLPSVYSGVKTIEFWNTDEFFVKGVQDLFDAKIEYRLRRDKELENERRTYREKLSQRNLSADESDLGSNIQIDGPTSASIDNIHNYSQHVQPGSYVESCASIQYNRPPCNTQHPYPRQNHHGQVPIDPSQYVQSAGPCNINISRNYGSTSSAPQQSQTNLIINMYGCNNVAAGYSPQFINKSAADDEEDDCDEERDSSASDGDQNRPTRKCDESLIYTRSEGDIVATSDGGIPPPQFRQKVTVSSIPVSEGSQASHSQEFNDQSYTEILEKEEEGGYHRGNDEETKVKEVDEHYPEQSHDTKVKTVF